MKNFETNNNEFAIKTVIPIHQSQSVQRHSKYSTKHNCNYSEYQSACIVLTLTTCTNCIKSAFAFYDRSVKHETPSLHVGHNIFNF